MGSKTTDSPDAFDFRRIRRLVKLMDDHDLTEVEIRQADMRIRLRRGPHGDQARPIGASPPPPSPAALAARESSAPERGEFVEITSPMVGTFYSANSPDAEPYVKVGSAVGPETTVCIIEAMKVFNEVPAEVSGTIVALLVENGEAVEYGRPLFRVKPTS